MSRGLTSLFMLLSISALLLLLLLSSLGTVNGHKVKKKRQNSTSEYILLKAVNPEKYKVKMASVSDTIKLPRNLYQLVAKISENNSDLEWDFRLEILWSLKQYKKYISKMSVEVLLLLAEIMMEPIDNEPTPYFILRQLKCKQCIGVDYFCRLFKSHDCCGLEPEALATLLKAATDRDLGKVYNFQGVEKKPSNLIQQDNTDYHHLKGFMQLGVNELLKTFPANSLLPLPVVDYTALSNDTQLLLFESFKDKIPSKVAKEWALFSINRGNETFIFRKLVKKLMETLSVPKQDSFVEEALTRILEHHVNLKASGDWNYSGQVRPYLAILCDLAPELVQKNWNVHEEKKLDEPFEGPDEEFASVVSKMKGWRFFKDGLRVFKLFHRSLPFESGELEELRLLPQHVVIRVFDYLMMLTSFHTHPEYAKRYKIIASYVMDIFEEPTELLSSLARVRAFRLLDIILLEGGGRSYFKSRLVRSFLYQWKRCHPGFLAVILQRLNLKLSPSALRTLNCKAIADLFEDFNDLGFTKSEPCVFFTNQRSRSKFIVKDINLRIPQVTARIIEKYPFMSIEVLRAILLFYLDIPLADTVIDTFDKDRFSFVEYSGFLNTMVERFCQVRRARFSLPAVKFSIREPIVFQKRELEAQSKTPSSSDG